MRDGEDRDRDHTPGQRLAKSASRGVTQSLTQIILAKNRPIPLQQVLLQGIGERIRRLVTVCHARSVMVARISAHKEQ